MIASVEALSRRSGVVVAVLLAACGAAADGPLTVSLGLPRDQVADELRRHEFCRRAEPPADSELFPRCDHPGLDWGEAWVVADYNGGRLVRLQRWERYGDDARAVERWNQLVAQRTRLSGPASDEARRQMLSRADLPPGTRTWTAFRAGDYTLVGVYLLTPSPPENAAILERIVVGAPASETPPAPPPQRPGCKDCAPVTE